MPDDRIFKFSSCGLMFLGVSLYFFYLFGGKIPVSQGQSAGIDYRLTEGFNIFLSLFFGTPIIGIIISTITVKIIFLCRGYKHYCYVPTDPELIIGVINRHQLQGIDENIDFRLWRNRRILERFYPFYQVEVRRIIKDEQLKFLDRRWSTTNTNTNNISAIIFAFLFMLVVRWKYFEFCDLFVTPGYMIMIFLVLIAYSGFALFHITQSRWEASEVEHACLLDFYRQENRETSSRLSTESHIPMKFKVSIKRFIIK